MRADFKDTHVIDPATVEGISEEQLLEQALKIPGAQLLSADELTIICELTAGAYRIADLLGMDVTLLGCSVRVDTQHIIATKEQMLDIQKTFS